MTTNSRNTFALVACVLTLAALVFFGAIAMEQRHAARRVETKSP